MIWQISLADHTCAIWQISLSDNTCAIWQISWSDNSEHVLLQSYNSLVYDVYLWLDRSVWLTTHVPRQYRIQLYLTYIYDLTDQFGWQHTCYFSLEFTCIWRISMIWPISLGDNTCATSVGNSLVYDVYLWIDRSVWVTTHVLLQSRIQLYMTYIYDLTDQFGWQLMCYFSLEFTCIWRISMVWPISLADNTCATSV